MDKIRKHNIQAHELDMDLMAEAELAKLQRQYRIMEGDRNAFSDEATIKLSKQRRVIQALRKEHENLLADFQVASCDANRQKDERISAIFGNLLSQYDDSTKKVQDVKGNLKELDVQIRKIEKQVFQLRPNKITDAQVQTRIRSGKKTVESLENNLETVIKRFCAVLAANRKIREEIDHLLKERARFNKIWEKLLTSLGDGKKMMLDLIEQTSLAYDQREEWCNKLQALRSRGQIDLLLHAQEMRELQRQLDLDNKLQEFLSTKGQKRIMRDLELKEARKKELQKENLEKELQTYEDTLRQIQEFTGEEDVERLAAQFLKQEEENFALFNYVNEVNHELKDISDNITQLQKNIDDQLELNESIAKEQKSDISFLKDDLQQATEEANQIQKELAEQEKKLQTLLGGIGNLFKVSRCNEAPILDLLGAKQEINNYNVFMYLGLIEKRIVELINVTYTKN